MGKRKPRKSGKPTLRAKTNLSAKQYAKLKRDADNARRRIKAFVMREGTGEYTVADPNQYTLASLVERLINGESLRTINRELKNITAEKIRSGKAPLGTSGGVKASSIQKQVDKPFVTPSGEELSGAEVRQLKQAIAKANQNISAAREKFSSVADIMPQEFSEKEMIEGIVNRTTFMNRLEDLKLFTPENLIPGSVNEEGLAGTVAEYEYYKRILERENLRREKVRAMTDPREQEGFFRQQADYDKQPIDISNLDTFEKLKKRATTWDDPARMARANLYLKNYEDSLELFEVALITSGFHNQVIAERLDYIRDIIDRLRFNEEAITYIANRVPDLSIEIVSPPRDREGNIIPSVGGQVDFDAIYNAWIDMEEMWL